MDPGSVRLDRLNAGGPLLKVHDTRTLDAVIGSVVPGSARIDQGRGVARVRFSEREDVSAIWADVQAGHLRAVSIGYQVHRFEVSRPANAPEVWRAVDWTPFEISAVPVGADPAAGFRSVDPLSPCVVDRDDASTKERIFMDETSVTTTAAQSAPEPVTRAAEAPVGKALPTQLTATGRSSLAAASAAVREVEVLHDQVLTWLESDPHLQPRDILVMVPDMGSCASLIHAVWGRFAPEDPRHIPYSVSDQTGQDHPMATIVQALLQGSQARITLDDWLSWLEVPAFAHACDFPTEEWASVREALSAAGVRWGLDGHHRVQSGVALSPQDATPNTWMHGLQRLLLAQAQGHRTETSWQGIWPAPGDCPISARALEIGRAHV